MQNVYILASDHKAFDAYLNAMRRYVSGDVKIIYLEIYEDAENVVFRPEDRLYATKNYWLNLEHYEIMLRLKRNNPDFDFGDVY